MNTNNCEKFFLHNRCDIADRIIRDSKHVTFVNRFKDTVGPIGKVEFYICLCSGYFNAHPLTSTGTPHNTMTVIHFFLREGLKCCIDSGVCPRIDKDVKVGKFHSVMYRMSDCSLIMDQNSLQEVICISNTGNAVES